MDDQLIAISKHDEALAEARDAIGAQSEDDLADLLGDITQLQHSRDPQLVIIGHLAGLGLLEAYISSGREEEL